MILALAVSVTACGGGGSSDSGKPPAPPASPTGHGELKAATLLNTISLSDIVQGLSSPDTRYQGLKPVYSVSAYRLEYLTSDAQGQLVRASGLVSVPLKAAGAKSPVLGYQHATTVRDADAPSNHAVVTVVTEVAVQLASLGYTVVAPDYVGYGVSKGTPHPYLLAAPSAAAVVDFLTGATTWRRNTGLADNGQLFLTGYSEGAYASMAAHRALQAGNALGLPVRLFDGRDDQTVPYASSLSTLQTMQARGAGSFVSLTDCAAVPSDPIACVPSFLAFMIAQFGAQALDL